MPFVKYTRAQRLEAVALAKHIGAEAAAGQLGMKPAAIRDWMAKAGDAPELAADPGSWRALMDIALARTTALVASGKLSPVQLATIAGIAARNAHREDETPDERTPAQELVDAIEAEFPLWRPDLVERAGSATAAFERALIDWIRIGDGAAEFDEAWLRSYDPATEAAAQAERSRLQREEYERLVAATRARYIVPPATQSPIPEDLDELLAEADKLLENLS